jgi:AraC-like DNA-binding protein
MNNTIREMHIIGPACRERFLPRLASGPLTRLGVTLGGVSDLAGRYCMSRPRPDFGLLLGTLDGRARLTTPASQVLLGPGDLLVAPAGPAYRYELIRGRRWRIVWFHLAGEAVTGNLRIVKTDILPRLARELTDLVEEASLRPFLEAEARRAKENYLAVLLRRLLGSETGALQVLHERSLQDLWRKVMDHLSRPWELPQLADLAGYSAGHLNRICRRYYGHGAVHYLTRLRMEYAAQLLVQGTRKIAAVARLCGYENAFAFSVAFRRQFGVPPSRYTQQGNC